MPLPTTSPGVASPAAQPVAITGPTQVINTAGYNVLTGANTYTGGTTIDNGTLAITTGGSITHPSADITIGKSGGDTAHSPSPPAGHVTSNYAWIGNSAGSTGHGHRWWRRQLLHHIGGLDCGQLGTGSLAITSDGSVVQRRTAIGYGVGGTGNVTVAARGAT